MPTPTEPEIQSMISNAVAVLDFLRVKGHVDTPNFLGLEDTFIQGLEGDYAEQASGAMRNGVRALYDRAIGNANQVLDPLLLTYAQVLGFPYTDPQRILSELYLNFQENSKSVLTRDFTFGTPTPAGGNQGGGTLHRLTVDEFARDIELTHADTTTVTCRADQNSGTNKHEERFEMAGTAAVRGVIDRTNSGLSGVFIDALSARNSLTFIQNPSFSQRGGTDTSPASFQGWVIENGALVTDIQFADGVAEVYRDFQGDVDPKSMKLLGGDVLIKQVLNERSVAVGRNQPLYLQCAYNREVGAGDGTLELSLGQSSASVVLAAQTGWNILRIPVDESAFLTNWNEDDAAVTIEYTGRTTGSVLVDDVVISPYTWFDGAWYALVGDQAPFLVEDEFTFSDTEVGSKIQRWMALTYDRFLPHSATPTWSDPT